MTRLALRVGLSLGVAALLLAGLMAWGGVTPGEVVATLGRLSLATWATALGLHAALYLLRALRFRMLIGEEAPGLAKLLPITSAYTLASLVLPAKLGEAAFVFYANRVGGVGAAQGVASLVVSRLLDLATLALSMALACLSLAAAGTHPHLAWLAPLGLALLLVCALVFAASARGDLVVRLAAWLSRALGLGRTRLGERILSRAGEVSAALRAMGDRRRLVAASLVSLPAWLCVFLFCAVLARGLGLPPETTLAEATFGSGVAIATSLLPLSAFANFGTLEAGWVLGFGALGVGSKLAYATGVGLHLVQLGNAAILGVLGHVGMGLSTLPVTPRR